MTKKKAASKRTKSATVKVAAMPHLPKMDRSEEIEQLVRQMYTTSVATWCKDNLDEKPDKEVLGSIVDNLTASFSSTFETLVESSTDSYLSTVTDDGDDEEDDDEEDEEEDEDEEDEDDD